MTDGDRTAGCLDRARLTSASFQARPGQQCKDLKDIYKEYFMYKRPYIKYIGTYMHTYLPKLDSRVSGLVVQPERIMPRMLIRSKLSPTLHTD